MTDWVHVEVSYDDGETWYHETLKSSSVIVHELCIYGLVTFENVLYRWTDGVVHCDA